jgi:hypothetical protein
MKIENPQHHIFPILLTLFLGSIYFNNAEALSIPDIQKYVYERIRVISFGSGPNAVTTPVNFNTGTQAAVELNKEALPIANNPTPTQITDFSTQPSLPQPGDSPVVGVGSNNAKSFDDKTQGCNFPKGSFAYQIGTTDGSGVKLTCKPSTIMVGYKGKISGLPKDIFGAGYFSTLIPKDDKENTKKYISISKPSGDGYGSRMFLDYNSKEAKAYVDEQLLHWKEEGILKKQSCVVVDVDNCDDIGGDNYKIVLDEIEQFNKNNNNGGVTIKVLAKNTQLVKCNLGKINFFTHPAVIGGLIEHGNKTEYKTELSKRNPNQMLIFASGAGTKTSASPGNVYTSKIENTERIPNSAYSYDSGAEYQHVYKCTYKPGGSNDSLLTS